MHLQVCFAFLYDVLSRLWRSEFANHTEAICTIRAFKAVEETAVVSSQPQYLSIAAVTFHSNDVRFDDGVWFAGVKQLHYLQLGGEQMSIVH